MSDTERWLAEYSANHKRTGIRFLHWVAVPSFIIGIVGFLWSLPIPNAFIDISPLLNWGITFLMATEVYYFIISVPLAIGMLPLLIAISVLMTTFQAGTDSALSISVTLLLLGCAGLYIGKGPSRSIRDLARDVQLIMIAPVWLLSRLYRCVGIPF